jgi:hypothetical protein
MWLHPRCLQEMRAEQQRQPNLYVAPSNNSGNKSNDKPKLRRVRLRGQV